MAQRKGAAPTGKAKLIPLPGSLLRPSEDARRTGRPGPAKHIHVSIYARRNPKRARTAASLPDRLGAQRPQARTYLTDTQFAAIYGAAPDDLRKIEAWVTRCGLKVGSCSVPHRRVTVHGPLRLVERTFGVTLYYYKQAGMPEYLGRQGEVLVPPELVECIQGVYGLDHRHTGSVRLRKGRHKPVHVRHHSTLKDRWPGLFLPPRLAGLYNFPPGLSGRKENIAVLAFNGGHRQSGRGGYRRPALRRYFERVLGSRMPKLVDVVVRGPGNDPGPDTPASSARGDATSEVMLDLCVVGALAPAAKIFVYFTEFTTQGWIDAFNDIIAGDRDISVVSVSYGNPEHDPDGAWTATGVKLVNEILQAAAAKGITVVCAAGDDGSRDQESSGAHVDFPASSPYALGVGGTRVLVAKDEPVIGSETVWNDLRRKKGATGGGVSFVFDRPRFQRRIRLPHPKKLPRLNGRGVPDVAAIADPLTGVVVIHVDGQRLMPMGGTSVGAPLWAALIARINEGLGARCGFLNPILYRRCRKGVLRDIVVGSNGSFDATRGWDACTGLGAPGGQSLLAALRGKR